MRKSCEKLLWQIQTFLLLVGDKINCVKNEGDSEIWHLGWMIQLLKYFYQFEPKIRTLWNNAATAVCTVNIIVDISTGYIIVKFCIATIIDESLIWITRSKFRVIGHVWFVSNCFYSMGTFIMDMSNTWKICCSTPTGAQV